jgi:ribulose 1,5-bisphosphate synthetase/thiazole synthase
MTVRREQAVSNSRLTSNDKGSGMPGNARYDVIIIGTGAGGGTLAYRLASSGLNILLLERGDYVRRKKSNLNVLDGNLSG